MGQLILVVVSFLFNLIIDLLIYLKIVAQTSYFRPLIDIFQTVTSTGRDKNLKEGKSQSKQMIEMGCRPRIKRKFVNVRNKLAV